MKRQLLFLLAFTFTTIVVLAQTKTSAQTGDWNNANTWTPAGVPAATDNVVITSNHRVSITSNAACNSLTVGTGGNAYLRFDSNTNRTFTVNGNVQVTAGARFRVAGPNATHTLIVKGNITNNGTINLYRNGNRNAQLVMMGSGNQLVTGNGIESRFYNIWINSGTSFNTIVEFNTTSFIVLTDFLKLVNGTFKYSKAATTNIIPFASAITIPSTAGFWMNAPTSITDLPAGISIAGKLTTSAGTVNVGNANNENLLYSSGTFSFTGGLTNIAGRFEGSAAASTCVFSMSGGTVNVPAFGSSSTTNPPFSIASAGSQFNMSGGRIILIREGGTGAQDLGYVNLAGSGTVTDGTLQIGTNIASQIFKINSSASIPNLLVNNATSTASLITNSINVVKDVLINAGTLNSNNLNITLGGNWVNSGGTFVPGTASVTLNSTSAQSIFKTGGETFNHLSFSGAGVKTFSSPVTANGNVNINASSNVDVSASNHSLTVRGNFTDNGLFTARSGSVILNGTASQNIGGASSTSFYDLSLNNTAGATLSGPKNLINALTLHNGTFNTNAQIFTMVSTATNTARIAQIPASADITGNVTVQRFVPGGTTGWALWGTPITSGLTLNDWDDDIAISCSTCPDGYVPNFPSIYTFDETAVGSYSDALSYIPLSSINDPIAANKGYWVYVGDGQVTTNNITVDVTGPVRKKNQSIPLSFTNNGPAADIGWNLIHNPYPSPISWAALKGTTPNIDNAIYVYNADLNGGTGANAAYVNGISSPAVGSGGIGDVIPMSQGFYVHSTGATALTVSEAIKASGNPTYLRSNQSNTNELLRLSLKGLSNYNDEVVLYTQVGSTTGFDPEYDAIKMSNPDPNSPYMALEKNNTLFQINGILPVSGTYTTLLKTATGYSGSYTISLNENTFPFGTCVRLTDRYTNTITDLVNSSYVFALSDTTTVSRFILSVSLNSLQASANVIHPTCASPNGGMVIAQPTNAGPWSFIWKDQTNTVIRTAINRSQPDTLALLNGGNYKVEITTVGGCDHYSSIQQVQQILPAFAMISCNDTTYLNQTPLVQFTNWSMNSVSYLWDFGDNVGSSTQTHPVYAYSSPGNYSVKLISTSATGCQDTAVKQLVVMNEPVGIRTIDAIGNSLVLKNFGGNHFQLEGKLSGNSQVLFSLIDVNGKKLMNGELNEMNSFKRSLDLDSSAAGVYFIKLTSGDKRWQYKLVVEH